jgi:hypothetical protein
MNSEDDTPNPKEGTTGKEYIDGVESHDPAPPPKS